MPDLHDDYSDNEASDGAPTDHYVAGDQAPFSTDGCFSRLHVFSPVNLLEEETDSDNGILSISGNMDPAPIGAEVSLHEYKKLHVPGDGFCMNHAVGAVRNALRNAFLTIYNCLHSIIIFISYF